MHMSTWVKNMFHWVKKKSLQSFFNSIVLADFTLPAILEPSDEKPTTKDVADIVKINVVHNVNLTAFSALFS